MKCKSSLAAAAEAESDCSRNAELVIEGEFPVCGPCGSMLSREGFKLDTLPTSFKRKFIRTTHVHTSRGSVLREDLPKNLDDILRSHNIAVFHYLRPDEGMTFDEICEVARQQYKEHMNETLNEGELAIELLQALSLDIVRVV